MSQVCHLAPAPISIRNSAAKLFLLPCSSSEHRTPLLIGSQRPPASSTNTPGLDLQSPPWPGLPFSLFPACQAPFPPPPPPPTSTVQRAVSSRDCSLSPWLLLWLEQSLSHQIPLQDAPFPRHLWHLNGLRYRPVFSPLPLLVPELPSQTSLHSRNLSYALFSINAMQYINNNMTKLCVCVFLFTMSIQFSLKHYSVPGKRMGHTGTMR